jgi:hypothetical protein
VTEIKFLQAVTSYMGLDKNTSLKNKTRVTIIFNYNIKQLQTQMAVVLARKHIKI